MHTLKAGPEFINAVSQKIRFWPSKLVSKLREPADSVDTFQPRLIRRRTIIIKAAPITSAMPLSPVRA